MYKFKTLTIFLFTFYFSMGVSKYIQILWFEKNDSVFNFSLSYSAMAVAGSFSFLLGKKVNQLSIKKGIFIFIPLYMAGMLLRIFPQPFFIPIISGAVSGIGAATVLLITRTWIAALIADHPEISSKLISSKAIISQIAMISTTFLSGQALYFLGESSASYISLLIMAPILLFGVFFIRDYPDDHIIKKTRNKTVLPSNKKIAILVYTLGILIGMNLGLVQPYLPIILKEVGQFNISFVSTLMTIVSVVQMLSSLFFRNKKMNQRPNIFFLIIELVIFIIFTFTGVMDLRHMIIIPVFLFAILITGFQIVREIMEYTMF
ncbi:MFS transporter [Heyndrickxia coagulans]|uniref:MFS transporter n=2 Tax=Heyndrickxia TaxID=2837504 RepID=A0A133KCP6_HEYCO|nr:MFS transporter [Heyndrickxia coagulans]KWZ77309.1 hypothetical protein HMPREF3213_03295 [Heyndrickxia coagulans]